MAAGLPKVVEGQDQAPLWSAQISVTDLENGAVGAVQGTDFSNQGGSAGLTAKWLYHYEHDGKLRLSFTEGADVEGHVLQVGHLTLAFPDNTSGNNSFTWENVEVDWKQGDALAARIVETTDGNTPATGLPQITGRPQVTEVLTADASGIVDADGLDSATFAYQWQSGGTDVALATNSEYTPTAPDQGKVITVKVSFEDDGGTAESITSRPTAPVLAANSKATGMPTISGTPQVWKALSADISTIDDQDGITNVSFSYQWASDDGNGPADIEGATGATFTPTASEVGHTVQVRVTFTDDAGNTEELTSAATLTVADGPPPVPTISSVIREHIGMLRVDWDDVPGATGYEISYLQHHITWITLPNAEFNYDAHFNGSKALVDGLVDRSNYSFRVRSLNAFGPSDWSEQFSNGFSGYEKYGVTTDPRPRIPGSPSEPRDPSATLSQHLKIQLSWTEPEEQGDSDVTGYRIEYQIRGSKMWNYLGTTPDTAWTHTELSPGRKFYYRVSAFNDHGRGRNSTRARGASFYDPQQGRWQPEVHKVKDDWELLPDGVDWQHGDRFRLMFITSDSRDVHSPNIGDYNEFVQDAAANGHEAVQEYSAGFRVLASTAAVDAVDNTGTHRTKEAPGLPVYWLEGTRVADNYADLYDGEWDDPRFSAEVRRATHTWFDDQKGLVTVVGTRTVWTFDADRGEYIYTNEHGESMYGNHCHGYHWQTWDYSIGDFDDNQIDLLPCIATGSNNNGRVHHSEYLDRCGFHNSLGGLCHEVAIGRPTRVLPEEEGDDRPLVHINPTFNFGQRSMQPRYLATSTSGPTNATVTLKDISTGRITYTFLFYALSPIFEVEADPGAERGRRRNRRGGGRGAGLHGHSAPGRSRRGDRGLRHPGTAPPPPARTTPPPREP